MKEKKNRYANVSAVYGPVRSWRLGLSLGVDLLCVNSICSFRCVYCQLGKINVHTMERKIYVPTERVMKDFSQSAWRDADAITFSGSGEPTLAANLGEVVQQIKKLTDKPIVVLTNATTLNDERVLKELCEADKIFCKLDAADEQTFRMINRPVAGISLQSVINGIKKLRREYSGHLAIQVMLQRIVRQHLDQLAKALIDIQPDEVQLNFPSRPIPRGWFIEARGNYERAPFPAIQPKAITSDEILEIESYLRKATGLNFAFAPSAKRASLV